VTPGILVPKVVAEWRYAAQPESLESKVRLALLGDPGEVLKILVALPLFYAANEIVGVVTAEPRRSTGTGPKCRRSPTSLNGRLFRAHACAGCRVRRQSGIVSVCTGANWDHTRSGCVTARRDPRHEGSGRGTVVMAQQPPEESSEADAANLRRRLCRRPRPRSGQRLIPEPLVWAMFVEEANVFVGDVVEMA